MIRRALIYLLLFGGSLVFAWPFIWMAATSAKLERERFRDVSGPRMDEAIAIIETRIGSATETLDPEIDRATALSQVARGIYAHLLNTMPRADWDKSTAELRQEIDQRISPELIADTIRSLRRAFCFGQLRLRSYDLQEDQLVAPQNAAASWNIGGTAQAALVQAGSPAEPYAELHYDFSRGNLVTLSQIFNTSFAVNRLHRIQLYLRNDDTWNAINLVVEKDAPHTPSTMPTSIGSSTPGKNADRMTAWTRFEHGLCCANSSAVRNS